MALLWGLKIALSISVKSLEIKGDSQLIVEATKGTMVAGWSIQAIIEDIQSLLAGLEEFTLQQVYREGNVVANNFGALGLDQEGLWCWRREDLLPPSALALLRSNLKDVHHGC